MKNVNNIKNTKHRKSLICRTDKQIRIKERQNSFVRKNCLIEQTQQYTHQIARQRSNHSSHLPELLTGLVREQDFAPGVGDIETTPIDKGSGGMQNDEPVVISGNLQP